MEEAIKTIKHKGYNINIYPDYDYQETPDDWGNEDVFLVAFHPDFSVEREGFDRGACAYLMGGDNWDLGDDERAKEIKREYHIFGLEAYIHSGVHLSLSYEGNYPDRRWDVSQLGVVFVKRRKGLTREKAEQSARSLLGNWNDILGGNVYGFTTEKDGEVIDSCWGFIGDLDESGVIDEAKATIDYQVKKDAERQVRKIKACILNKVPFEKRI